MAPYSDDVQSPDWLRDYPSNGGDALAYQEKGHLWDTAEKAGVSVKNYGEYVEYNTFTPPGCTLNNNYTSYTSAGAGSTGGGVVSSVTPLPYTQSLSCEPLWIDWYNDVLAYESGKEKPALQLQICLLVHAAPDPLQGHGAKLSAVRPEHP